MIKTRIQFKIDKTENWNESFQPLAGELCIFSDYEDTKNKNHLGNKIYKSNIKIGSGNKALSNLLFLFEEGIEEASIRDLFTISETTAEL